MHDPPPRILHLTDQMQLRQSATIGNARHRLCHLQRRSEQTALTDRHVRRVPVEDPPPLVLEHPFVVGHQSRSLANQRQARALAESQLPGKIQKRRRSHLDPDLIEPRVTRARQGPLHIDRSLRNLRPVVKHRPPNTNGCGTINRRGLRHHPVVERGQRHHRLE